MATSDLVRKPAHELAELVRTKQVSSVELTKAYLERITALNPKVNAFITVTDDHALARAREADNAIAAGKYLGPLHGIPYAPKDILATKGIRTTNGSKLTADWVPDHESTVTTRLNRAGAVIVGKLNLLEAMGATLVDVEVPHANLAGSAGWIVAMAEAACFHEKRLREKPELFDPLVRERLEAAKFYPATDYIKSLRVRTILMNEIRRVFATCDVMAVPGSGALPAKLEPPAIAASDVRPGSAPAPYRGGNTCIGNMTGLPAIVVPCGFSAGPPVFPITMMLYGRPFDEATLFRVSHAYEAATAWHTRRPALGAA